MISNKKMGIVLRGKFKATQFNFILKNTIFSSVLKVQTLLTVCLFLIPNQRDCIATIDPWM